MGVNHVQFGNQTLIDLRNDTAEPSGVTKGMTFHNRNGELMIGTYEQSLGLLVSGVVDTVGELPVSATHGALWLVGTESPYEGYIYLDGRWVDAGEMTPGPQGEEGNRGPGLLFITTSPTAYTTPIGSFTPSYRILLATVVLESGFSDVYVGDVLECQNYHYPVGYVDEDSGYVYCGDRTNMKGATGAPASVQSEVIEYQVGESGTSVPSGAWSSTIPSVPKGSYLWTKVTVTFNSGNPAIWYSVAYVPRDGQGTAGQNTPLTDTTGGQIGVSTAFSREDHRHPLNVPISGTPAMDGVGSQGVAATYSRSDHVHPSDTSKANKARVIEIALSSTWSGSGPYTQSVSIQGASSNSKVDLQPDSVVIAQLIEDEVRGLYIENNAGVFTAYAVGSAPTVALTVQATIMEVTT